jgi:pilus assembly protein CpaE
MSARICVHRLGDLGQSLPEKMSIAARTETRDQLMTALGAISADVLLVDLDQPESLHEIVGALELRPHLVVVGAAGKSDLNVIIASQRAGCSQIVAKPINSDDLAGAIRRALPQTREHAGGKTYALIGACGGNGVTTLACHLAAELSSLTGAPTCLMDLDLEFGGIARAFDLAPGLTITDLADASEVEPQMLQRVAANVAGRVHLVARPNSIIDVQHLSESQVLHVERVAAQTFPFVVADLPRKLDAITGHVIENCTKLVIVVQLNVPNVDNARRLLDALTHGAVSPDRIEIVVNRYKKGIVPFSLEMLEKQVGRKVLAVVPNDYQAVSQSIDTGQPLAERNAVRAAIADLAGKLVGRNPDPVDAPVGGWLNLIGRKSAGAAR